MITRQAGIDDVPAVVETLTLAFDTDPAWSKVFADDETRARHLTRLWTLLVEGALRYDTVWMTERAEAVSVWLPPSGSELSPEQEVELDAFVAGLPVATAARARTLFDLFDSNHPHEPPHHYLSLLGTHPDHRGQGIGMALVASDLERIDALGEPAYLESTNPANLDRYARQGFYAIGGFEAPDAGTVTTMWRDARAS